MNSTPPEARAQTLILWATLIAGVALVILMIDLRAKQDLLEVYRHEQAKRGNGHGPGGAGRDLVDDPARAPQERVPDAPGPVDGDSSTPHRPADRAVGDA